MKILPLVLVSFMAPLSAWAATDALPIMDYSHTLGGSQRPYRDYSKEFEEERDIREKEGVEKGFRLGAEKAKKQLIKNMIELSWTDETIAAAMKLSKDDIAIYRSELAAGAK